MQRDDDAVADEDQPTSRLEEPTTGLDYSEATRQFDANQAAASQPEAAIHATTAYETNIHPETCSECGSQMVWANVSGYVSVSQIEGSHLLPKSSAMSALVCPYCGYTKFYAKDPGRLLE